MNTNRAGIKMPDSSNEDVDVVNETDIAPPNTVIPSTRKATFNY